MVNYNILIGFKLDFAVNTLYDDMLVERNVVLLVNCVKLFVLLR